MATSVIIILSTLDRLPFTGTSYLPQLRNEYYTVTRTSQNVDVSFPLETSPDHLALTLSPRIPLSLILQIPMKKTLPPDTTTNNNPQPLTPTRAILIAEPAGPVLNASVSNSVVCKNSPRTKPFLPVVVNNPASCPTISQPQNLRLRA